MLYVSEGINEIQKRIQQPSRAETVSKAVSWIYKQIKAYAYMCLRKERSGSISQHDLTEALFKTVPMSVEERAKLLDNDWLIKEFKVAVEQLRKTESALRLNNKGQIPEFAGKMLYPVQPGLQHRCHGCNATDHFRKVCPHKRATCEKCHRRGHTKDACKSMFLPNNDDRAKVEVREMKGRVEALLKTDSTVPAQLKTMQTVISEMLARKDSLVRKSKERRNEKKRTNEKMSVGFVRGEGKDEEKNLKEEEIELSSSSEEEEEEWEKTSLNHNGDQGKPTIEQQGLPHVTVGINGKATTVLLDSGAAVNVMSFRTAKDLGVEVMDDNPVELKGIGKVNAWQSKMVKIDFNRKEFITSFKIITEDSPVIISNDELQKWGLVMDFERKEI
eukprot:Selendium_serpulae@DN6344_c0_g2_i4.p1